MDLTGILQTIPVEFVLKAVKSVKKLALAIAVIGAVVSFGTQVGLLESWHLSRMFAVGIAATVDALAICAMIALNVPGLPKRFRREIGGILFFTLSVSIAANVTAGLKESVGAAIGHSWPVVAYMLAEYITNRLRTFLLMVLAAQAAQVQATQSTPEPVHATATTPTTAPAPTKAVTKKPGTAKEKILQLASAIPTPTPEEIADKVGTKPGWVKHVIKTSTTA